MKRDKLLKERNWNYIDMATSWTFLNRNTIEDIEIELFEGTDDSCEFVYIYLSNLFKELSKNKIVDLIKITKC